MEAIGDPLLIACVAVLCTVGLQQVHSALWSSVRLGLRSGGFYLKAIAEAGMRTITFEAAEIAFVFLGFGCLLLSQIRNVFQSFIKLARHGLPAASVGLIVWFHHQYSDYSL